jgi:hypothetical protein
MRRVDRAAGDGKAARVLPDLQPAAPQNVAKRDDGCMTTKPPSERDEREPVVTLAALADELLVGLGDLLDVEVVETRDGRLAVSKSAARRVLSRFELGDSPRVRA